MFVRPTRHRSESNRQQSLARAANTAVHSRAVQFESLEDRRHFSVTALFVAGALNVFGDSANNAITVSRDAAGKLLVNGGAVSVIGGTPTVANTGLITMFGLAGNDTLTLDEANGALPRALIFGGSGNDVLTGGSGGDLLFGEGGNDQLLGKGGFDLLFGGADNDILTGGDADDQAFGQGGDDRMIWNPGDDTDLNEGGDGNDTVEVNGGNGSEIFTATANGSRVRFDRINPAPFSIDIGTSENLVLNAKDGDDSFSAIGNLAALIKISVDGGAGNDTILGGNGAETLIGGDGNDFIDGNQGNDLALMGAGDDVFQWDAGDGSDIVEGQDGTDKMIFNGSGNNESFEASANGSRVRFTRSVGTIVMDLDGVEAIDLNALGGEDNTTVNDMSATDLTEINVNLAGTVGGTSRDASADNVIVNATNGDDVILVVGDSGSATAFGLATQVNMSNFEPADKLTVNLLAGDDVLEASGLAANSIPFAGSGGDGNDILIGGAGNDILTGGAGDDVLIGGAGQDVLDGAPGNDIVMQD